MFFPLNIIGTQAPGIRGGQGIDGFTPTGRIVRTFTNRSGAALEAGDVQMVDVLLAATESVTLDNAVDSDGLGTGGLSNVINPSALAILGQAPLIVAVALEAIADNAKGSFCIWGECDAYVIAGSGSVAVGSQLVVTTGLNFDLEDATGEQYRAIGLEAVASPIVHTLGSVFVWNTFSLVADRGGVT